MTQKESSSVFAEWADVTTAHGFVDFSRSKSIVGKLIWFILIFFSLTMMCYQLYSSVKDFISHEWKTSIQEVRLNPDVGLEFPTIVACNANRFKYSKVQEYNMTLDMVRYLFMNLMAFSTYLVPSFLNETTQQEFFNWRKNHNFTLDDIYENMCPNVSDFVPTGAQANQTLAATYANEYGKCMKVDIGTNSTRVGAKGGTQVIFDTQSWDYLPIVENNYILEGIALQVVYEANAEIGKWIMMYPGTYVAVGMQVVQESVRVTDSSVLNPFTLLNSQAPCEPNPKMKFLSQFRPYSQTNCLMECTWQIPLTLCNCTPFMYIGTGRMCEIEEYYHCFGYNGSSTDTGKAIPFLSPDLQNLIKQCESQCGKPCSNRYIETTISQTKFPSDVIADKLQNWLMENNIGTKNPRDTIVLDIYFNTLKTKTIEMYEVMSFDNLISSSGGLIGLWAGMSFLTIFQAIAYFLKYLGLVKETHSKTTKVHKINRSQSF